jgi:hypothetical protein
MKEIGGYLELERFSGEEYYPDAVAVNNGRCALRYILRAKKIETLYLPIFLCDSVKKACEAEGVRTVFYHIGMDFLPKLDDEPEENAWFYIVNYYGQLKDDQILALRLCYPHLIMDHVQSFFHHPLPGIDTVYSCRKFFGVPDGGYAVTDATPLNDLPQDHSMNRMEHLLGRLEGSAASDYYAAFKENDRSFADSELMLMSKLTHNLLRGIQYKMIKERRESNFMILDEVLKSINPLQPKLPEGPYAYPFYYERGIELKQKLAKKGIFVPTLWPNVLDKGNKLEQCLAANILPLPVDQRYSGEEMLYMQEEIKKCIN